MGLSLETFLTSPMLSVDEPDSTAPGVQWVAVLVDFSSLTHKITRPGRQSAVQQRMDCAEIVDYYLGFQAVEINISQEPGPTLA